MRSTKLAVAGFLTAAVMGISGGAALASAPRSSSVDTQCKGEGAIEIVSEHVVQPTVAHPGSIHVSVRLRDECAGVTVKLPVYGAPTWNPNPSVEELRAQRLVGSVAAIELQPGATKAIDAVMPTACYQADLITGASVIDRFSETVQYGLQGRLVKAYHGFDKCSAYVAPSASETTTTTSTSASTTSTSTTTTTTSTTSTTTTTAPQAAGTSAPPKSGGPTALDASGAPVKPSRSNVLPATAVKSGAISAAPAQKPSVLGALATTGSPVVYVLAIGAALVLAGVLLRLIAIEFRRSHA